MSNYTKLVNFAAKDSLPSGDASKLIKGTEINTELNNIATAVNSKADSNSSALTGTPTAPTAAEGTNTTQIATTAYVYNLVGGLTATPAELNVLDGITATTAELNVLDGITATTAELNYVDGVTSNIQTQIDAKLTSSSNLSDLTNAETARTNLGLGTAAVTNSTAYATAAQGALADSALQSFTESDPTVPAHVKSITTTNVSNWNTAYGWGNHASAGYLTSIASNSIDADKLNVAGNGTAGYALTSDGDGSFSWTALSSGGLGSVVEDTTPQLGGTLDANGNTIDMGVNVITDTAVGNWNTAYGWGDHSAAGYQPSASALTTSSSFGGDVSGTYNAIVIADDSHNHIISNVDGLQTALDAKEPTQTAASQAEMEAGTQTATRSMSPLRVAQAIAALGVQTSGNMATTGHWKDENTGFTINWGKALNVSANATVAKTLDEPFANAGLIALATYNESNAGLGDAVCTSTLTTTQISVTNGSGASADINWLAIGY